ncbi:MAG TPA: hypothetical protein VHU41_00045 [Thermoanaerobaculia bacterium]|jgi:hypothetical protein|nr:hypothetical protein [Thermoanaerobaculia bacterium]
MTFAVALFLAAANLCTVPAAVQNEVVKRFPGYVIPASDPCAHVVRGDFDCNKMEDYALLIEHTQTGRVLLVTSLSSKKGNLVEIHRVGELGKIGTVRLALAKPPKVKGARCQAISFGDKLLYRVGNDWKISGNPAAGKP